MTSQSKFQALQQDLKHQKELLENRRQHDQETVIAVGEKESVGELSSYDNHPADLGTELYDKKRNLAILNHDAED
jgi:hypothetical protein